ncbi:MAG: transcription/translation regulatory transformer protein RfaH [Gammaproteobacteria bacterium]|nr:transcription/translation regulatory transformer protein RfaH [Gammaproteobacteria bacterium]
MKNWYLIYTKPQGEELAKVNLERQGFETYLPLVGVRRRRLGRGRVSIEPLFPRYLFIHLNTETDNWLPIRSTMGVSKLIRFGMQPAIVPDPLIEALRERENAQGVQDIKIGHYKQGEKVRVLEGPMMGFEGIFLAKTSSDRVIVLLNIVGKSTRVKLDIDKLESTA